MKIAFLGASSQIAKGLLKEFCLENIHNFYLFTRDTDSFNDWIESSKLDLKNIKLKSFNNFNSSLELDLIINFVGINLGFCFF